MAENDTLLAHLSPRLTSRTEDIAVKALEYILKSSEAAVRSLENLIREGGLEIDRISRVATWSSGPEMTIPDLVGFDERNKERMLIEAKFWAGLTEHQPNGYLNRLPNDEPSVLLFVAPEARIETLWTSIRRRVEDAGQELEDAGVSMDRMRSAAMVGTKKHLMLVSWLSLLGSMQTGANNAGDSGIEADIRQLRGLTQREDSRAFMPLRAEELGPSFIHRMVQFRSLARDAIDKGKREGWIVGNGRSGQWLGGYGWPIQLDGVSAWFGVHGDLWAREGDTPLWLQINDIGIEVIPEGTSRKFHLILTQYNTIAAPINLKTGVEHDDVVDNVVDSILCSPPLTCGRSKSGSGLTPTPPPRPFPQPPKPQLVTKGLVGLLVGALPFQVGQVFRYGHVQPQRC